MRIAELSRRASVPIATIKFYIREGMLPRGTPTGRTQAAYTDAHLERLALIGTLQAAGLSLATIKQALTAMEGAAGDTPDYLAIAVGGLPARDGRTDPATTARAEALLRTLIEQRGWQVEPGGPVWEATVRACASILTAWPAAVTDAGLDRYAAVAEQLAAFELPEDWNPTRSPTEALQYVVLGTVLFEPLILALRRLAHIDRGATLRARRTRAAAAPPSDHAPLPADSGPR